MNAAAHILAKNMGVQKRIMAVVLPSPANQVCLNALGTRRVVGCLNTYWTNNKIRSAEAQNKRDAQINKAAFTSSVYAFKLSRSSAALIFDLVSLGMGPIFRILAVKVSNVFCSRLYSGRVVEAVIMRRNSIPYL